MDFSRFGDQTVYYIIAPKDVENCHYIREKRFFFSGPDFMLGLKNTTFRVSGDGFASS